MNTCTFEFGLIIDYPPMIRPNLKLPTRGSKVGILPLDWVWVVESGLGGGWVLVALGSFA